MRALFFFPLVLLAACNQASSVHSERTRDWYMQHDTERLARVPECKNDAAQLATPDCQNAIAAQQQITVLGK
ncbi:EexN family lipoprotein [Caballeronia sordidicola]|uniref:EexN family lipoprotein n=1 Tax=Caballeronia sordidicola TaxID=196367 RepID=UPI003594744E